jgi:hypothetical protein
MWDENPAGMWQLRVEDTKVNTPGTLVSWRVVIYHTDPNNFSEKGSRPIQVDDPPPAPTPSVIVITQSTAQATPAPTADAVPVTLVAASTDQWRFRLGPLHDAESMGFRFADIDYGERDGPNGDKWSDGAAPFGFGLDEERNGLVFATKFALNSTSAIFRKVIFLSAAQINVISRLRISCASDDYATVFFNGIPVFGESPPARPRNYAYWNDAEEFGRVIVKQGAQRGRRAPLQRRHVVRHGDGLAARGVGVYRLVVSGANASANARADAAANDPHHGCASHRHDGRTSHWH